MSGNLISLAAARRARSLPARDRLTAQAEVQGRSVVILARDRDTFYTPAAVRSFARGLLTLADTAEGIATLSEPEAVARLSLLADAVARLDGGEAGVGHVVGLLREMTAEVRR